MPEREFEETEHKAAAVRRAIELAAGLEAPVATPADGGRDSSAGGDAAAVDAGQHATAGTKTRA